MTELRICDICGHSEEDHPQGDLKALFKIQRDEDGLWVCNQCQANLTTKPIGWADTDQDALDDRIKALIGKSAGAICRTPELPFVPPYRSIIEAASRIAYDEDRYMSAWSFVTQWMDGTTVWESGDKASRAIVAPNGNIQVEAW